MGNFIRKTLPMLLSLAGTFLTFLFKKKNDEEAMDKAMERWMKNHSE